MKSKEIKCTQNMELYNIYWGDIDDDSFSIKCNISEDDLKKELKYFKSNVDFENLWEDFPSFLNERGYTAKRHLNEEPTYINFDEV